MERFLWLDCKIPFPDQRWIDHRAFEPGETPEQAVEREISKEMSIGLKAREALGFLDHVWSWKGRVVSGASGTRQCVVWRTAVTQFGETELCPAGLGQLLVRYGRWNTAGG